LREAKKEQIDRDKQALLERLKKDLNKNKGGSGVKKQKVSK
jgi:hypothetical protein